MATSRVAFTLDPVLAEQARRLGVDISAAARRGVADAVHAAMLRADVDVYRRHPERSDPFWQEVEAWGEE